MRIVLEKPDLKVLDVRTQVFVENLLNRSVRFDILATDSTGAKINVEIQRADKGAERKRARYHSMYYTTLADRVRFFKESKEGILIMCKVMEDMRKESLQEGIKEGAINTAKRMLADGMLTLEKIAEYAGLPLDEVKKLKAKWTNPNDNFRYRFHASRGSSPEAD